MSIRIAGVMVTEHDRRDKERQRAPVSVLGVWTANQVASTDRYVANVTPLIREPAVRAALTDKITAAVSKRIDVQGVAKQAAAQLSRRGLTRLGALLSNFSGSIAGAANGLIHSTVARIVSSPLVVRLWIQGNKAAHTQLVNALAGRKSTLSVSNGKVVIGLGPLIGDVKARLAARGLTLVNSLPPINPTFPLFSAKYLVRARSANRLLTTLMLVLAIALALGRAIYLSKVQASVLPADAAAVAFDTIVRFVRQGLRVLLAAGLVVALAAFFTGPSVTAVTTRRGFRAAFATIRGTGERAGLSTGRTGAWVYPHRTALRVAAASAAVLIFVFWRAPTGLVVLLIAILHAVTLGLIELIGRPPEQPRQASEAH